MMTQRQYSALKSKLTRAERSGDPFKVLDATRDAFALFEEVGYPDAWHRWNIARMDAEMAIARLKADGRTLRSLR